MKRKKSTVHVDRHVRRVYVPQFFSRHNKDLEWQTLKPPWRVIALGSWIDCVIALRSQKDHVIALRQISVTALFYLEDSRKIHLQGVRARRYKDTKRRAPQLTAEREPFGSSFYMFFFFSSSSPWACPMHIGLGQECWDFYLKSSLQSLDLPLFYFRGLFPSLSFRHRHFGLLFSILTT